MRHFIETLFINSRLCFLEITTNPTRSFLTSFGIFLGIASLLITISFIRALEQDIQNNMEKLGGLNIISIKTKTPVDIKQQRYFNRSPGLKIQDAYEIVARFPYTVSVLPNLELSWNPIFSNGKKSYARVCAVGADHFRVYNITVQFGNLLSNSDYEKGYNFCIIGKKIASDLFIDPASAVGKTIFMNSYPFVVKGVTFTEEDYERKARTIFLPFSFYSRKYKQSSTDLNELSLEIKNSNYVNKAIIDFRNLLLQRHRGIDDTEITSNISKMKDMKKTSKGINILLICIAGISLTVGSISIMNIMFATIGDRIKEIGLRKAIGANDSDIFFQFIIESIMLCFVGGIPGVFIGSMITLFPKGFFPFNPTLSTSDFIIAFAFIIMTGLISGLSPSIMAAQMQPAEALKY